MTEISAALQDLVGDSPHHISVLTSLAPTETDRFRRLTADYCKFNEVVVSVAAVLCFLEQIHKTSGS